MSSGSLYLFGDQSADLLPSICDLHTRSSQCEPLRGFLRAATDTIQLLLANIPIHIRPRCPSFDSVLELIRNIDLEEDCTALLASLLSISQLGSLIYHLVSNPRALESDTTPTLFGICTGSITAAAVASCQNLTEVLNIAPQIIDLTFHVGLEASRRSQILERSKRSWATTVSNFAEDTIREIIESFNKIYSDNSHKQVYISAIGLNSVTVSGPPSALDKLFNSVTRFQNSKKFDLPIKAAFHARHLVQVSPHKILDKIHPETLERVIKHILVSPCSNQPYQSRSLGGVLEKVLIEILQRPIDFYASTGRLAEVLTHSVAVYPMGPVPALRTIEQTLANHKVEHPKPCVTSRNGSLRGGSGAVAIVGMSARLPGSENLEEFWQILEEGRDLHEKIRDDRFDWKSHCDPTGKMMNTSLTPYGVFIDRPGYFDPRFFNMSPREALQTDPQQRLMLLTTYEALENAGYAPNRTPSTNTRRIASFIGQTSDDYREVNAGQEIDTYFITGGIRAFGPGRINYHFGWEGPSFSLDTACSSSAASIQLACSALLARECDTAIGGGANLLTSSDLFAGLSKGNFLSKTGGCKTFDQNADGYVRADGCGVLVLKRLEDAMQDRDNILAVMRGASTNHSAEAVSITHPHNETQQRLFETVLDKASLSPQDVDYAELHGTGTQAGDATESKSVTSVLCRNRDASHPLYLGSVKPNMGHSEAASGVTSIIKVILMMQKNIIPPHVGIKGRMNQKLPPFKDLNAHISLGKTPFLPRIDGDGKRRVLINNFDAAGGNTSLLLEDPPILTVNDLDPRSSHVVALSAKSSTSMSNNARRLLGYLRKNQSVRLEDLAYTTCARRMHYPLRQAFTVSTCEQLISELESYMSTTQHHATRSLSAPSTVFCFSGQGSQYASMGRVLYQTLPSFRELIDEYDAVCIGHGFPSFLPMILGKSETSITPVQSQLGLVAIELALTSVWKSFGVQPKAVIGHSVGEYAALCCAGVISTSDCLYLVGQRASLMLSSCSPGTHAMLAVQASSKTIEDILKASDLTSCAISCFNSPRSVSISGFTTEIDQLYESLRARNLRATRLDVPFAFHSSQLDSIIAAYVKIADNVQFAKPTIPVASTLLGEVVTSADVFDALYLGKQTRAPVNFQAALCALRKQSLSDDRTVFIEIGCKPICLGMVNSTLEGVQTLLPSLKQTEDDWQSLGSSVAMAYNVGIEVNWAEYHRPFESSLRLLSLPNYSFDLKNYWIPYRGDWALRKGQSRDESSSIAKTRAPVASFSTTTLQRIENEKIETDQIIVTFASDTTEPILNGALRGHLVNGAGLCPSSIYADMAFTAARYLHKLAGTREHLSLDVCNMDVHRPLLIKTGSANQTIRVTATLQQSSKEVYVNYSSEESSTVTEHAHCAVRAGRGEDWQASWARHAYLIRARMGQLIKGAEEGTVHKILRSMAYRLFASFVDYDERYQGMEEVYLDSAQNEACAKIKFRTNVGNFTYSPYWIDSVAHLSGFVLNGSDTTPSDCVFISHGWSSMKFLGSLSTDRQYESYVRMQPTMTKGVMSGDVYLFEGDQVVGLVEDLKFQQVKRAILDHLLPNTPSMPRKPAPARLNIDYSPYDVLTPRAAPCAPAVPAVTPADGKSEFSNVLRVIADEIDIDVSELEDDVEFAGFGVDSLLTISILDKLGRRLNVELPPTLFSDCPSVRELRSWYLSRSERKKDTTINLPSYQHSSDACSLQGYDPFSGDDCPDTPISDYGETDIVPSRIDTAEMVKKIIAHEVGISPQEIEPHTLLSELGIDSLLSLSILARIRDQMGMGLSSTFFIEHPTFEDIQRTLRGSR